MKTFSKLLLIVCLSVISLLLTKQTFAFNPAFKTGTTVTILADEVIDQSFIILSGDIVEVYGTVTGDLYVFGGQVLISGTVQGDLIAAGGMINITGTVNQDARLAGGQLDIDGLINGNLTMLGGNLELGPNSNISGGMLAAGGNLLVLGFLGHDTLVGVGNAVFSNQINGDLQAYTGNLRLTPSASISGNLTIPIEAETEISPEAFISGSTLTVNLPGDPKQINSEQTQQKIRELFIGIGIFLSFISFFSSLIVGLLLIKLMPNFIKLTTTTLILHPLKNLVIGFLTLLLTPAIFVVFLLSIFGIPLLGIFTMWLLLMIYFSKIIIANWLGMKAFKLFGNPTPSNKYLVFTVGLFALFILKSIPIIGWLFSFIFLILGLGTLLMSKKTFYSQLKKHNLN